MEKYPGIKHFSHILADIVRNVPPQPANSEPVIANSTLEPSYNFSLPGLDEAMAADQNALDLARNLPLSSFAPIALHVIRSRAGADTNPKTISKISENIIVDGFDYYLATAALHAVHIRQRLKECPWQRAPNYFDPEIYKAMIGSIYFLRQTKATTKLIEPVVLLLSQSSGETGISLPRLFKLSHAYEQAPGFFRNANSNPITLAECLKDSERTPPLVRAIMTEETVIRLLHPWLFGPKYDHTKGFTMLELKDLSKKLGMVDFCSALISVAEFYAINREFWSVESRGLKRQQICTYLIGYALDCLEKTRNSIEETMYSQLSSQISYIRKTILVDQNLDFNHVANRPVITSQ